MANPYLPKDIIRYIGSQADDKTVLQMMLSNPREIDNNYIKRLVETRYPLLIRYKKNEETWKRFYSRMIYYLSVLAEQGLPYIPHPAFNPELLFQFKDVKKYLMNMGLQYAAALGDMDLVKHFVSLDATTFNGAMEGAAKAGHMNIVKYLVSLGANNFNFAMYLAALGGHLDLVKYLVSAGATLFHFAIPWAESEGHTDIVKYLKSL